MKYRECGDTLNTTANGLNYRQNLSWVFLKFIFPDDTTTAADVLKRCLLYNNNNNNIY